MTQIAASAIPRLTRFFGSRIRDAAYAQAQDFTHGMVGVTLGRDGFL